MRGTLTIVIPTFNRSDLLGECLESLHTQTGAAMKVLVVDDSLSVRTQMDLCLRLNDLSVAAISSHGERLRQGDAEFPVLLDQRTGRPSSGVLAVVLATPLATDAQALATTMMILGNREGQLRLGNVDPAPAVLWLLGDGSGEPLLATYRWSSLGSP